jgi:hypothetical protein
MDIQMYKFIFYIMWSIILQIVWMKHSPNIINNNLNYLILNIGIDLQNMLTINVTKMYL